MKFKVIRIVVIMIISATIIGVCTKTTSAAVQALSAVISAFLGAVVSSLYEMIDTKGQTFVT